tara:strand:+ start:650 stop:790 length:141 start_codon:yes stop_codon:yes gene_type:complete
MSGNNNNDKLLKQFCKENIKATREYFINLLNAKKIIEDDDDDDDYD